MPWKYGYKSIKSIVKIKLVEKEPPTTWNLANAHEYGFYSNVNPEVDHPRWSQAKERRLPSLTMRPTLKFNGYEDQVGSLYAGMDLKKWLLTPRMPKIRWTKVLVFLLCLTPEALLVWDWHKDALGPNPAENIIHTNGNWTIHFLLITLAITPLRRLLGMPSLIQFRRMIGLFAFFYGCLHLFSYLWFDQSFDWAAIWKDVYKRPFITVGFAAWLLMVRSR